MIEALPPWPRLAWHGHVVLWLLTAGLVLAPARIVGAQASALIAPGPLSKAHSRLEGLANCAKCHEPGKQVTASRCLACHQPIAERIAAHRGVHRAVAGDCVSCHSEHNGVDAELRPFDRQRFDHAAETGFALDGRHAAIAGNCAKCHTGRSFLQARPACAACHADPHKGALGTSCATCHSTQQPFADARRGFDHSRAKFALVGAHRAVECARCHVNKVFSGLRFASCSDCHQTPHRQVLARDCTACHGNDSWKTQKMDHARTAFPLRGRHDAVACASCHRASPVRARLEFGRCAACHTDVHRGQFKEDCASCHKETGFAAVPFDHAARTKFPLTGRHAGLPCARCHAAAASPAALAVPSPARPSERPRAPTRAATSVLFAGASSACASCHADPHRGDTASDCSTCHTTNDFKVASYQHDARLAPFFGGRHATSSCADCHGRLSPRSFVRHPTGSGPAAAATAAVQAAPPTNAAVPRPSPVANWRFKALGTTCRTCHADAHEGQFDAACDTCHAIEDTGFRASRFSHDKTGFPLAGRHRAVACATCHRGPASARPTDRMDAAGANGAVPRGAAITLVSARQQATQPATSPLIFKGIGKDCASCHADVHLGQLGTACQRCHGPESFRIAGFKHTGPKASSFFQGTHATLVCRACHKPEQAQFPAATGVATRYVGMGTRCSTCHADNDTHRGALGKECESCHQVSAWKSASRAFHKAGLFPLEGRHLAVACGSCHTNGVTKGTPTGCYDCHWVRRQDDRYQTRLGVQCEQCHRPSGWVPVQWNHGATTGFQLSLAHQVLRCDNCHKDGHFASASNNCVGCHQADFARAARPNHLAAGFPTNCEVCHTAAQTSWHQATFDHARSFPLVGVHALQACAACHRADVFAGTPRDCVGCHRADYQRTANPNHASAGFPATCESCHRPSDTAWRGASFNHTAFFPLVGAHATQACASCHKNSVYRGTARDCVGCHQADYQRTANPNHAAAGLPTACESCHRVSDPTWSGGSFNHSSFFPLVGTHATQACSACHKSGVYKGTARDCMGCHQPDYQRTANPNHAAAGFPTACESCHSASSPSWSASFNHAGVFPLVGVHATQACSACHKNGVYKGTPRDCMGCHQSDYQRTANPNHAAAGFPTTCESCHSASSPIVVGVVQPRERVSARRAACHAAVQRLSQERRLQGHGARLRRLPPGGLPADREPEPRRGRFPDRLPVVPPCNRQQLAAGDLQPHAVPDHVGPALGPGLLVLPHHSQQLRGLQLHELPRPLSDRLPPHGRVRLSLRFGRLLRLSPQRAGQLMRGADMSRTRLPLGYAATMLLACGMLLGAGSAARAQTVTRPAWGRISFFGNSWNTGSGQSGATTSEVIGTATFESPSGETVNYEYRADIRFAGYPNSTDRTRRVSIYDAYLGARFRRGTMAVRGGQMWLNELGGLGAVGGGMFQVGQQHREGHGRWRAVAFGGLEPNILDAGYVTNVFKAGAFAAFDDAGLRRHVLGFVTIRDAGVTERSVLVVNNLLPLGKKLFVYQAGEYRRQERGRPRAGQPHVPLCECALYRERGVGDPGQLSPRPLDRLEVDRPRST